MLHEYPKRDVVRENLGARTLAVMSYARVQLGHQESRLALVLVAENIPRHREAVIHDHLRIGLRRLEQVAESHVLLLLVVPLFSPGRARLAVEHHHMEKCIKEQYRVRSDRLGVEQRGLRRAVERVGEESGLDHDQRIRRVLLVQYISVVGRLVWARVEELQELRPPQVEDELRKEAAELWRQPDIM